MPEEAKNDAETVEMVELPFPTYYTNNMNITSSGLDFSMLVMERLDQENQTIRARIVMTPAHAKLLLSTLAKQIAIHESNWGEIQLPRRVNLSSTEPEPQP